MSDSAESGVTGLQLKPAYVRDPAALAAYPATLVATWPRHNAGRYTEPLYDAASLEWIIGLANEVLGIATSGTTPEGDGVNTQTLLWAQEWRSRLGRSGGHGQNEQAHGRAESGG